MKSKKLIKRPPYSTFIRELHSLLKLSGITPSRFSVRAEVNPEKNWNNPTEESLDQKVGKVILYIEEHFSEELSLDELAGKIDLSKYQLIRGFRKEEGTTPWKFLIEKRIEKVKENLADGMSPVQAAVECGFYDQSHMNKAFREATGQTPKEYQEKNFRNRN